MRLHREAIRERAEVEMMCFEEQISENREDIVEFASKVRQIQQTLQMIVEYMKDPEHNTSTLDKITDIEKKISK
jgi:hypothetical protein